MTERIPTRIIETVDATKPVRLTPAKAGGPIHTRSFSGFFRNARLVVGGLLFALFFGTAWLNWNGRQAVLWDLGARQFHVFGTTFWPQDFILLSALLIIAAFGLFFITVLAGRVWCGYACPQSTWTWVFMWAEKITEGDRNQRIKLDAASWSLNKLLRRGAKHAIWLAVSLLTAVAFIGYFTPVRELAIGLLTFSLDMEVAVWVTLFAAATYLNAGWLREKVCLHMCPYSRFQSVMFDANTLNVSYDSTRGESRGPRKKGADHRAQGLGDCTDCTMCVQVCPTGIDIRDGLQLDCVSCGACIDACDEVMDKMGYARGLIRYASEQSLQGQKTQLFRPRLVGYGLVLLAMIGAFIWALEERALVSLDVTKDRTLYRENTQGQVENMYTLKVINKAQQEQQYAIELNDANFELQGPKLLKLAAGEIVDVPYSVTLVNERGVASTSDIRFSIRSADDESVRDSVTSTFIAPVIR
ncbi:cytochrome c oxidase accessory protein CcoG [Stutzerimonas nitrititolerans]|uniref:cytochrome c oxidase accessory protein CcoG n=1 Tax=Stutzerimonas nitrititolerans TaxID=2482751 RepID=UPI00289DB60E|nr:cytochrome c oxidase accessory protein CcoG [Stutzerimonas nitrititolerans]